jgi:hypothetical protein
VPTRLIHRSSGSFIVVGGPRSPGSLNGYDHLGLPPHGLAVWALDGAQFKVPRPAHGKSPPAELRRDGGGSSEDGGLWPPHHLEGAVPLMLTREDDIDVHALRREGWTISAIARHRLAADLSSVTGWWIGE